MKIVDQSKECPFCHEHIDINAKQCIKCGKELYPKSYYSKNGNYTAHYVEDSIKEIKIVDFDMPFYSMMRFMVKWAIASIPALIVLAIAFMAWGAFIAGILSSFFTK